jgi:hypothetical protein
MDLECPCRLHTFTFFSPPFSVILIFLFLCPDAFAAFLLAQLSLLCALLKAA